jgi:hypothetical protein
MKKDFGILPVKSGILPWRNYCGAGHDQDDKCRTRLDACISAQNRYFQKPLKFTTHIYVGCVWWNFDEISLKQTQVMSRKYNCGDFLRTLYMYLNNQMICFLEDRKSNANRTLGNLSLDSRYMSHTNKSQQGRSAWSDMSARLG